jgi:hypothetical protein
MIVIRVAWVSAAGLFAAAGVVHSVVGLYGKAFLGCALAALCLWRGLHE